MRKSRFSEEQATMFNTRQVHLLGMALGACLTCAFIGACAGCKTPRPSSVEEQNHSSTQSACVSTSGRGDASSVATGENRPLLTAEVAKMALGELIASLPKSSTERLVLDNVNEVHITQETPEKIHIGPWKCNLVLKTFSFEFVNIDSDPPRFYRRTGVFAQDATGNWRATTKEIMQN
jgi:hypothetical protein